jgi:ABC-type phosphate transport system substrate-binding protein
MSRSIPLLIALVGLLISLPAVAGDFVVIVNKENTFKVDGTVVARIYTGEKKIWEDGTPVMAIDLPESSPARVDFSTGLLKRTVVALKSLWAQMVFAGKALPPKVVSSDDDVKKVVSANKGAIGYVKASSVDKSVKVAIRFKEAFQ